MDDIGRFYAASDATDIAAAVRSGDVTASEMAEAAIALCEKLNPALNAVIHKTYDMARRTAAATGKGSDASFTGVPFLLKELASSWKGAPVTNSSRFLRDMVAPDDSGAAARLRSSGLMLVGKSNAPENGWSIATEPVLYGATVNPWDAAITPGGSSGGSAAAVAAGIVPVAEASDGAGSIRIPASCCGIVGLKPSRGRVSLWPMADYWAGGAYFLCVSRTVRDTARYLDVLSGAPPGEPYAPPQIEGSYVDALTVRPRPLTIGLVTTGPHGVDPDIVAAVEATGHALEALGHRVEPLRMSLDFDGLWQTYTDMTCVETAAFYAVMAEFVGRPVTPDDVEPVTWAIIERGRATPATAHAGRIEALRQTGRAIAMELDPFDIVVTPTLTQKPRPPGFYDMSMTDLDAYNALWSDAAYGFPFNVSGLPAMSLPLGQAGTVPLGVQLIGRYGREEVVLRTAAQLEEGMPWSGRRPQLRA